VENEIPPLRLWVEAWAQRNRCDLTSSVEHPQEGLTVETWQNCDENTTVALYSRERGDHVWPGSESGEQLEGAPANMNATDVIWEFFESHPRP
jgi:polyhydroxybutyrate depolymerase